MNLNEEEKLEIEHSLNASRKIVKKFEELIIELGTDYTHNKMSSLEFRHNNELFSDGLNEIEKFVKELEEILNSGEKRI